MAYVMIILNLRQVLIPAAAPDESVTIDGLFERTEFGSSSSAQDTVYVTGLNNELVMQRTKASGEYLAMSDPEVYNVVFDRTTAAGFMKYASFYVSDKLFDAKTSKRFFLCIAALLLILCLCRFIGYVRINGFARSVHESLTPLLLLFFFSTFTLFQGCYLVDTENQEKPEWMIEDLPPDYTDDGIDAVSGSDTATDSDETVAVGGDETASDPVFVQPDTGVTPDEDKTDDKVTIAETKYNLPKADDYDYSLPVDIATPSNNTDTSKAQNPVTKVQYDRTGIPKAGVLFFHPDYTGNIAYTTNSLGDVQMRMVYKPYGEVGIAGDDDFRSKFNKATRSVAALLTA